jgi:hypothetical protein
MFSRYVVVAVVALSFGAADHIAKAEQHAGVAFWFDEGKMDFVTNTEKRKKILMVVSNESDYVQLLLDFENESWGVVNGKPLNEWSRDLMGEENTTVLYRGNQMKSAVSIDLIKLPLRTTGGLYLTSLNMNHGRQILSSQKVGVKVCGENYTFEMTHPNVAKGRDAMTRLLGQK